VVKRLGLSIFRALPRCVTADRCIFTSVPISTEVRESAAITGAGRKKLRRAGQQSNTRCGPVRDPTFDLGYPAFGQNRTGLQEYRQESARQKGIDKNVERCRRYPTILSRAGSKLVDGSSGRSMPVQPRSSDAGRCSPFGNPGPRHGAGEPGCDGHYENPTERRTERDEEDAV
jgi:hypothetical protein